MDRSTDYREPLASRIHELERQLRLWRISGVGLIMLALISLALRSGQAQQAIDPGVDPTDASPAACRYGPTAPAPP